MKFYVLIAPDSTATATKVQPMPGGDDLVVTVDVAVSVDEPRRAKSKRSLRRDVNAVCALHDAIRDFYDGEDIYASMADMLGMGRSRVYACLVRGDRIAVNIDGGGS